MRVVFLALAAFPIAGLAQAGSIENILTNNKSTSIEHISCANCAPLKAEAEKVPEITLEPGTQRVEVRQVNGEMKVFRTEAWMGGSPIVFVSKATEAMINEQVAQKPLPETPSEGEANMIDKSATTSAVAADIGASAKVTPALNQDDFQLRLK